jgi:hypothetical protein
MISKRESLRCRKAPCRTSGSRCGWPGGGVAVPCQARRLCETPAVTGDERPAMRVSALFYPEPQTWGLRGDPYLWRALRAHLAGQDISG